MQTRYYDPEIGRFISQDGIDYAKLDAVNGINLYAYCGNNPIMAIDPNGNSFLSKVGNWFKNAGNSIKNFFVEDVYGGVIKPATDWVVDVAAPAVGNFFTGTIPDFFTNTVPDFFVNTVWNGGLKPAWNAVSNFFTNTVPDFFVNTFWNDWIVDKVWNTFCVDWVWNTFCVDWVWNTFCVDWVWNKFCVDYVWNDLWKNLSEDKIFLGIVSFVSIASFFAHPVIGLCVSIFSGLLWFRTLFD